MITTEHLEALSNAAPLPSAGEGDPLNPVQPPQTYANPFDAANAEILGAVEKLSDDTDKVIVPLDQPLRDPVTGQFVAKPADADASAVVPDGTPDVDAPAEAPAPEAPPVVDTITVLDRNGKELPIEISDPEAAEALRMLKNNGMRKEEWNRRSTALEARERDFRELQALMATPESLAAQLGPDVQVRMLNYLLANHFDTVKPTLENWYANDIERQRYQLEGERQMMSQSAQIKQQVVEGDRVSGIQRAIEALIPEHATVQDATDFYRLAAAEIGDVDTQRGKTLKAADVPALLDRHLARFGFQPTAQTPTPANLLPSASAVAAPQGAKAEAIAKAAQATAKRMATLPVQQQAVRAVAPQGAGTAPAVRPIAQNFDQATDMIKQIYRESGRR